MAWTASRHLPLWTEGGGGSFADISLCDGTTVWANTLDSAHRLRAYVAATGLRDSAKDIVVSSDENGAFLDGSDNRRIWFVGNSRAVQFDLDSGEFVSSSFLRIGTLGRSRGGYSDASRVWLLFDRNFRAFNKTTGARDAAADWSVEHTPGPVYASGSTVWVSDADKRLHAYNQSTRERDAVRDIVLDASTHAESSTRSISSDGTVMFVGRHESNFNRETTFFEPADNSLYAYTIASRSRTSSRDIELVGELQVDGDIHNDDETIWGVSKDAGRILAFKLSDGSRDISKEIALDAANDDPRGLWGNSSTMWVGDQTDDRLYAYAMSTMARDSSKDFVLVAGNDDPTSHWSNGTTMWVADNDTDIYAYSMSTRQRDSAKDIDGHLRWTGLAGFSNTIRASYSHGGQGGVVEYVDRVNVGGPDLGTEEVDGLGSATLETQWVVHGLEATLWKTTEEHTSEARGLEIDASLASGVSTSGSAQRSHSASANGLAITAVLAANAPTTGTAAVAHVNHTAAGAALALTAVLFQNPPVSHGIKAVAGDLAATAVLSSPGTVHTVPGRHLANATGLVASAEFAEEADTALTPPPPRSQLMRDATRDSPLVTSFLVQGAAASDTVVRVFGIDVINRFGAVVYQDFDAVSLAASGGVRDTGLTAPRLSIGDVAYLSPSWYVDLGGQLHRVGADGTTARILDDQDTAADTVSAIPGRTDALWIGDRAWDIEDDTLIPALHLAVDPEESALLSDILVYHSPSTRRTLLPRVDLDAVDGSGNVRPDRRFYLDLPGDGQASDVHALAHHDATDTLWLLHSSQLLGYSTRTVAAAISADASGLAATAALAALVSTGHVPAVRVSARAAGLSASADLASDVEVSGTTSSRHVSSATGLAATAALAADAAAVASHVPQALSALADGLTAAAVLSRPTTALDRPLSISVPANGLAASAALSSPAVSVVTPRPQPVPSESYSVEASGLSATAALSRPLTAGPSDVVEVEFQPIGAVSDAESNEEYRLLEMGDDRYAETPGDYVMEDGRRFLAHAGLLEIGDIPVSVVIGTSPLDFQIADPESHLLASVLDESLRGREVKVWTLYGLHAGAELRLEYAGFVNNAAYADRTVSIRAGSWFSGFETAFPRRTTSDDQKAINSNDTCFDRMDGGNAIARVKFDWQSE